MSAGRLLTVGLGTPFSAVKYLVTLGLGTAGTPPVPPVVITTTPSGVRAKRGGKGGKRELIVRLSDVESRKDTAEFLKSQLRQHQEVIPEPARPKPILKLSKADRAKQSKLAVEALRAMQIEAKDEERTIVDQNNEILKLIVIACT